MSVFTGSAVAIVTPFHNDADQTVNYDALRNYLIFRLRTEPMPLWCADPQANLQR